MGRKSSGNPPSAPPSIPVDIQRELRKTQAIVANLQAKLGNQETQLETKLSETDILKIAELVRAELQASGKFPLSLQQLPGQTGQPQKSYTNIASSFPVAPTKGQLTVKSGQLYYWTGLKWVLVTGNSGAVVKTTNYTATGNDSGKLIVFNSGAPVVLTLPPTPPSLNWTIGAANIGAGSLTVFPNGLHIDGSLASITGIATDQGLEIKTDLSNYFTDRGMGSGGGGGSTTHTEVLVDGNSNLVFANGDLIYIPGVAN